MRKNVLGGKLLRNAKKSIKYQEDKYFSVSLHIFLIAIYLSYPLLIILIRQDVKYLMYKNILTTTIIVGFLFCIQRKKQTKESGNKGKLNISSSK